MPSPKELAKALARQDSVTQQPRNRFLGAVADAAGYLSDQADRYVVPERDPLFGGMRGGDLLPLRNVNRLLDDLSYGGRITTGRGQTTTLRPEVVDTVALGGAMRPFIQKGGEAALKTIAEQVQNKTGLLGRNVIDPRMRMFAGEGAKTADKQALKVAKDMKAAGVPDEVIHAKTKWFFGSADGKPRFEIDDSPATIRGVGTVERVAGRQGTNMGDVMRHPSLYDAYQNTSKIPLEFRGKSGGAYGTDMYGNEGIMLGKNVSGESTPLHELQHSIQRQEGFATGGSPDMFMRGYQNKLKDLDAQVTDINQQMRAASGTPQYDELMNARSGIVKQIQAIEGRDGLGALEAANKDYRRLAGEAEARLTQSRMNMTAAERAASYPPSMFDVPVKDQIVRYGDAQAMSVPERNGVGGAMIQRPKTEFEILHDTAQRNAALPVEQGGLGLPEGNTYIDRANAPGMYPTDAYHFTNARFSEFDPKSIGSATDEGWLGSGFYTTTDKKLGDNWNKQVSMPMRVADQNNLEVPYTNFGQDKRSNVSGALGEMGNMTPIEVNDALNNLGKTGITMDYSPSGYLHKEIMSVAPNQLRSRFAAFDPMRRHEADILAGVGVGGMLDPQAIAEALRQQDRK
jgi:hypothetical protein